MKPTIFSRLMIGYLTIFFLVSAVSVYAILKLHQSNTGTRYILRIDNSILDYKEKLNDSILSQLRFERKYAITKDMLFYNQFLSAKEEFNQFFLEVLFMADTPQKKESLRKIETYYRRYLSLTEEEMTHVRMNRPYPRRYYEQEIGKTTEGILEELKKLETQSRHDIRHRIKKLEEAAASTRELAILLSTIAILLAIATSLFITRGITKPLNLLMKKTREISRGAFNSDLDIPSPPEISELAGSFNAMCRQLKTVDKMKSDFFSSMSHELRTPLTSIKEGISLLQEGVGGTIADKQKRLLTILTEESNRLIDLVNSLLDLSKMEAGMMTYTFEEESLVPLIERAMMEMAPLVEGKKISLGAMLGRDLPFLRMDREKILQTLRNLIGNAVKFSPEGGRVTVTAQRMNQEVKVSVADTGPGIPKDDLASIFEKFHQAPFPHSDQFKGTGLGLAIVKHVITAHGGKVWAESELGQGSSFIFVLPV